MARRNRATTIPQPDGSLAFYSSYDPGLVAALKLEIPAQDRRWDPAQKAWLVAPQHEGTLSNLVDQHLGCTMDRQSATYQRPVGPQRRTIEVRYMGSAKDRGGDVPIAYGFADGAWSIAIPLPVLRRWFEPGDDEARPGEASTFYGVLGLKRDAIPEQIKRAYRRMAAQWHPDVCQEPDAHEQFLKIGRAYEVLSDYGQRAKYDAGLRLAASVGGTPTTWGNLDTGQTTPWGWRAPLRCGLLEVEGTSHVGRFTVNRILRWDDIQDPQGRTLVVSWPRGGDTWTEAWV